MIENAEVATNIRSQDLGQGSSEESEQCCSAIGRMLVIPFVRIPLIVILGLWSAGNIISKAIILFYQMNDSRDCSFTIKNCVGKWNIQKCK